MNRTDQPTFQGLTVEIIDYDPTSGPYPRTKIRYLGSPGTPAEWVASSAIVITTPPPPPVPKAAPPKPGITRNGSYTIRAVITTSGRDTAWFVAAQETVSGSHWVTWRAEQNSALDDGAALLAYSSGNYFYSADPAANRRRALADLAVRAGLMPEIALRIADEVRQQGNSAPDADRRMAGRLRTWAAC